MRLLPLYRTESLPPGFRPEYNAGLWYNKFFDMWAADWRLKAGETTGKKEWVGALDAKDVGSRALIEEAVKRMTRLVGVLGGEIRCFATAWHFVTGLGLEHPVENGFTWHYGLGVPFLPASSVKGVVRAWAGIKGVENQEISRIFGSRGAAGSIIFFDALPVGPVKLKADVMTPHYSNYHQEKDKGGKPSCPGDWDDPNPIPFLTVAPNQAFMFPMAPRRKDRSEDCADLRQVLGWLEEALEWIGAGAKTATGYGRFDRRSAIEGGLRAELVKQQEADKLKAMSLIRREMEDDGYSDENKEVFMAELTVKWLARMDSSDTTVEDRREIAGYLAQWYQKRMPGQWKKPKRKNIEKVNKIKEALKA